MTLPAPNMVEILDYEAILADRTQAFLNLIPEGDRENVAAILALESEPVTKLLQEASYRELVLRGRINDAATSNLIAFAQGTDLDALGELFDLSRLPDEPDTRYRIRLKLRIAAMAGNGTREHYRGVALSVSTQVLDAAIISPYPGAVDVVIWPAPGADAQALLIEVRQTFGQDHIKMLGVDLLVRLATPRPVPVTATLWREAAAPANLVSQIAAAWPAQLQAHAALGQSIARSWIYSSLHTAGIAKLTLVMVDDAILIGPDEYAVPGEISLTDGGIAW